MEPDRSLGDYPFWDDPKCAGNDSMYPERNDPLGIKAAKAVCTGGDGLGVCPEFDRCRAYALKHKEVYGVWGGLSERERSIMFRKERRLARERRQAEEG